MEWERGGDIRRGGQEVERQGKDMGYWGGVCGKVDEGGGEGKVCCRWRRAA